ncbi:FtsX-like permease family protein [Aeromicrobium phragmitis]|uniref:FtsX-like permease family protein n=1 Tax=Aeromicrobium phragmitis TaxID=2478914 RepID=A0A3L8PL60_9ACTN|nr:FtsX-like permease family protein [Aeromicrobium phragmitis]RLV56136.1 FtsX-like permease family protein [Aeromicrobium phragmitis]
MRTVTLASLRLYTRRYVAAFLAVAIGVAFIITIGALNASAKDGLTAGAGQPYRGSDVVASDVYDVSDARTIVEAVEADGGAASVLGYAMEPLQAGAASGDTTLGVVADDEALRWQTLISGSWPRVPGEVLVDEQAAKSNGVAVGDTVQIGGLELDVVGVASAGKALTSSDFYGLWTDVSSFENSLWIDSVPVRGTDEAAITAVAPDAVVMATDDHVRELQAELTRGADTLTLMLLVFVTVALTVAAIVIANTFSILFAQRTSDIAMLRCVGATRAQVRRSVRLEALAIGLFSSTVGLLAGVGFGFGIVALIRSLFPAVGLGDASVAPLWFLAAFAVGVIVTVAAAWLPTRATTRISPLAALRPAGDGDVRTTAGKLRVAFGAVLLLAGAALLTLAVTGASVVAMLGGGVLAFVSVLVLGPVIVPPMIRLAGRATGPLTGATGRIATDNAIRNPKRTATTTSALLVGVTLTSAVVVGMSSAGAAVDEESRASYPIDAALASTTPLRADALDRVLAIPGVEDAVALDGVPVTIDGIATPAVALPRDAGVIDGDRNALPGEAEIALPFEILDELNFPQTVTVEAGGRTIELRPTESSSPWGPTPVVGVETMRALTERAQPLVLWVGTDDSTDGNDLVGDLRAVATGLDATLFSTIEKQRFMSQQVDVMTAVVVGLLGIAVLIALVGIGSTLGLSVLERRRENALLRALGVTRRQLRATLVVEAMLLAGAAAVLGVGIGTLFGWIGVKVMIEQMVATGAVLVIPVGQLAAIIAIAAVAGVLASVLPSRTAARTAPAAGLTLE